MILRKCVLVGNCNFSIKKPFLFKKKIKPQKIKKPLLFFKENLTFFKSFKFTASLPRG